MSPFVHVRRVDWSGQTHQWRVICECCPPSIDSFRQMRYSTWRKAFLSACVHASYHEPERDYANPLDPDGDGSEYYALRPKRGVT
jgi:hypothetical protein